MKIFSKYTVGNGRWWWWWSTCSLLFGSFSMRKKVREKKMPFGFDSVIIILLAVLDRLTRPAPLRAPLIGFLYFCFVFFFFFVGRSRGCDHRIRTDDYDRGRADWRWFLSSAIGSAASLLTRTEASPTSIPSMGIRLFVGPFGLSMGNVAFFIEKKMFLPSLFPSYAENRFLFVPSVGTRRIESRFRTCRSAVLEFQFWFSFTESQFQASKIGGSVE